MRATWVLLLVGCYSPSPKSGAYRCSTADNACPVSQHCVCGLCVSHDADAACGFSVDATLAMTVSEHQAFPVTISALQKDGTAATGFNDTVTLGFTLPDGTRWCDVTPSTVQLSSGKAANVMVTLNRETIPPQKPRLTALFAGNQGASAGLTVNAPPFTKDLTATVPAASALKPFGWADNIVAEPAVIYDGSGFRMYFAGATIKMGARAGIGVATSTDGKSFTARPDPVFQPADNTWYSGSVEAPAPFFSRAGVSMAFSGTQATADLTPPAEIGLATSSDGLAAFVVGNGGNPVLKRAIMGMQMADCDYCGDAVDFPQVLDDPTNLAADGGLGGKLMFFSATQNKVAAIGLASSSDDGMTWLPEPAPVLSGDIGGEAILVAPHVLVDGTVYKMWYSFARLRDALNPNASECDIPIEIGYATSVDGVYWVRSPSNNANPPVMSGTGGWDAGVQAFLAGSAIASDGKDPSKGITLFYTTLTHTIPADLSSPCMPNGIGRATRL
jgi:hypothetical protein